MGKKRHRKKTNEYRQHRQHKRWGKRRKERLATGISSINGYKGSTVEDDTIAIQRVKWIENDFDHKQEKGEHSDADKVTSNEVITSKEFFERFVAERKPVVISGLPESKEWGLSKWRGDEGLGYFISRAGDCEVKVECKSSQGHFGAGLPKRQLKFREFIGLLRKGETQHYLTTQANEEDCVVAPPANMLKGDFPDRPALLGNLISHRINLWMGSSSHGTSSGLHHDFHDNLYLLVRGKKRFTLFSPIDTERMYTHGKPTKIFWNGLIDYEPCRSGANRRADGAHKAEVANFKLSEANENLQQLEAKENVAHDEIEAAEAKVNACMEEMLEVGIDGDDDTHQRDSGSGSRIDDDEDAKGVSSHPDSFSKIAVGELRGFVEKGIIPASHPLIQHTKPLVVTVEAGEMLYLPAGWFHEVTSFGAGIPFSDSESSSSPAIHIALNYWMYPPGQRDFDHPYEDGYWDHVTKCRGIW
eukprot:CAMPEP_0114529922 /NCGR_PEP_ID=MMETSP0109-20121206/25130_1 /TAXON_ID=29199 /ORGANISM="Chlorarachnion reptans, Strain CCCM449" /LENGTH=471 /DNA_ID=CAMNT_0001712431 /DNA_START=117 /DNA_END=1529 /DNA_ORIENTATION=+